MFFGLLKKEGAVENVKINGCGYGKNDRFGIDSEVTISYHSQTKVCPDTSSQKCKYCGCVFTYQDEDIKVSPYPQYDGDTPFIRCPHCNSVIDNPDKKEYKGE